jgi:beta-xylosidase
VDLVEELDEPDEEDLLEDNLVQIRAAHTAEEAKKVKELLQRHGILCVVEFTGVSKNSNPSNLKVLVNRKDEPRAQELVNAAGL